MFSGELNYFIKFFHFEIKKKLTNLENHLNSSTPKLTHDEMKNVENLIKDLEADKNALDTEWLDDNNIIDFCELFVNENICVEYK